MTILNRDVAGSRDIWIIFGKSDETKPTDGVPENSIYYAWDSDTSYFFDGTSWEAGA